MQMRKIVETLSAAKAPKKDGKGNPYADRFHHYIPLFEAMRTGSRKAFKRGEKSACLRNVKIRKYYFRKTERNLPMFT